MAGWLMRLGMLCSARPGDASLDERVGLYLQMLTDVPIGAFTAQSVKDIATASPFFPSYGELRKRLEAWWDIHQPRTPAPALPGPGAHARLDAMAQRWVACWFKRITEDDCGTESRRANLLNLIRERSPEAYDYVVNSDQTAAMVVVRRRLPERAGDVSEAVRADWADRTVVLGRVRRIIDPLDDETPPSAANVRMLLGLLRGLVGKHAPENLDLVPEFAPPPETFATQPATARSPQPLSAAALATLLRAEIARTTNKAVADLMRARLEHLLASHPEIASGPVAEGKDQREPSTTE